MSLFGDLPPLTAHLRPKQENPEEEYQPQPLQSNFQVENGDGADADEENAPDRPDKRQRLEAQEKSALSTEQVRLSLIRRLHTTCDAIQCCNESRHILYSLS